MEKNYNARNHLTLLAGTFPCCLFTAAANDGKLRIIVFGAHPDDCELKAGGVAAMWAKLGHKVKFVSTTNGDIGHAIMAGGQLAKRRTREVKEAAKILGIESHVMDNHDGELMPTQPSAPPKNKSLPRPSAAAHAPPPIVSAKNSSSYMVKKRAKHTKSRSIRTLRIRPSTQP